MSMRNISIPVSWDKFSADPAERHEQLVAYFGRRVMQLRMGAIINARRLIEDASARDRLGAIHREPFVRCANLPPEGQDAALKLGQSIADNVLYLVLTLISGTGIDERLDENHAINWRLVAEVMDIDAEAIVYEEVINRGGEKFFPDYWGRWLNLRLSEEHKGDVK